MAEIEDEFNYEGLELTLLQKRLAKAQRLTRDDVKGMLAEFNEDFGKKPLDLSGVQLWANVSLTKTIESSGDNNTQEDCDEDDDDEESDPTDTIQEEAPKSTPSDGMMGDDEEPEHFKINHSLNNLRFRKNISLPYGMVNKLYEKVVVAIEHADDYSVSLKDSWVEDAFDLIVRASLPCDDADVLHLANSLIRNVRMSRTVEKNDYAWGLKVIREASAFCNWEGDVKNQETFKVEANNLLHDMENTGWGTIEPLKEMHTTLLSTTLALAESPLYRSFVESGLVLEAQWEKLNDAWNNNDGSTVNQPAEERTSALPLPPEVQEMERAFTQPTPNDFEKLFEALPIDENVRLGMLERTHTRGQTRLNRKLESLRLRLGSLDSAKGLAKKTKTPPTAHTQHPEQP